MAIFPGSAIPSAVSDYEIDNSLRFEDADNPVLYLDTFGSPTNAKKFTISFWTKRGNLSTTQRLMGAKINGTNSAGHFFFHTDDELQWYFLTSGDTEYRIDTKAVFRDPSAWYHVLLSYDSTNVTAADRMQIHVNGTRQEVDKGGNGDPPTDTLACFNENNSIYAIGSTIANASTPTFEYPYDGYLAEFYFIDGTQLAPASFGELSSTTNQWIPLDSDTVKDAVTFGTNGFFQKYNSTELATSFTDSSEQSYTVAAGKTSLEVLVVAGGGGGGGYSGGGGGGGGIVHHSSLAVTPGQVISLSVGAGGAETVGAGGEANQGENSTFGDITALGGGRGWRWSTTPYSSSGGSGSGACAEDANRTGGAATQGDSGGGTGYGNAGGNNNHSFPPYTSGGGGGAGAVGVAGSDASGGNGGAGQLFSNFTSYGVSGYFGGGGGGGVHWSGTPAAGSGGTGGGGTAYASATRGQAGTALTGGGGGGGWQGGSDSGGGAGGSGTVIVYDGTTYTQFAPGSSHTITANGDVKNVRGANLDTTYSVIDAFTSTGADTWTCPAGVTSIELLSVAGGGGGAYRYYGGGGGAGGIIHDTSYTVVPGVVYDLSVGAGGAAGAAAGEGADGGDTVWNVNAEGSGITFTADGGGGGSGTGNGNPGGSGGGAKGSEGSSYTGGAATQASPTGATGYGYAGGNEIDWGGAGGGGSSEVGGSPDTPTGKGGDGGDGRLFSTFVAYGTDSSNVASTGSNGGYFGGGGGGGAYPDSSSSIGGVGGIGGGGKGAKDEGGAVNAVAGTANTGGGGGAGAWGGGGTANGKAGGSGILLIAYNLTKPGSSSIEFDGSGDYLSTAASSDWNFGTDGFTVEFWANGDSNTTRRESFTLGAGSNNINFDFNESSSPIWVYWGSDGSADASRRITPSGSAGDYTDGKWRHLALVRNGTTVTFYVDGASVGSQTGYSAALDCSASGVQVGRMTSSGVADWLGYMDEIRISNTARYTTTFTPQTTQFTADANTKLLIHSDWTGGLGADSSGNFNAFTPTNLVATDQMIDVPTNNWCTLNPLLGGAAELAEGNLLFDPDASPDTTKSSSGTIGATSGKWYYEFYIHDVTNNGPIGARDDAGLWDETGGPPGYCEYAAESGGAIYLDGLSTISSVGSYVATDIIGVAVNMDDGEIQWFKNGAVLSGSGNVPVTMPATTAAGFVPYVRGYSPDKYCANFGQDSSFAGTVTAQGNQDDNDVGDFYYTPPSGFLALCIDNLSTPEIALPGENFNTVLYTGNNQLAQSITGVGFEPDLVWIKRRNYAGGNHVVFDQVRGVNKELQVNADGAEGTRTGSLNSFDSDGWTTSTDNGTNVNLGTYTYVNWNWKAGGAPTADNSAGAGATPTAGSVKIDGANLGSALAGSVQVDRLSANTTNGFSMVKFPGDGSVETVGHGLSQAPELITFKGMGDTSNWPVYHKDLNGGASPENYYVYLNHDSAESASAAFWNDTAPTASVFTIGSTGSPAADTPYIAYCFHSVEGYSKVGSYAGNSNADGTFVYCGFKPAYVLNKMIEPHTYGWVVEDSVRDPYNAAGYQLYPNTNGVEGANHPRIDFVSNGFKWRDGSYDINHSSSTYLFIAFAESPFKYSNAR